MLNHIFVTDDDNSDSILPELPRIKPAIQPPPPTHKTNIFQDVGDVALAGAKGVVGAAQGLVGLADIPTGGHAGKFIQDRVIDLPNVSNWLGSLQSQKQQENEAALQNANGFVNTLGVLADRPSLIPSAIAESIPSMYAGAGIGRATGAVANALGKGISSKVLPFLGEGEIMAGQQAENIRQQSPDQLLSPGGTAAAMGTGVLGSGVAALGGRLANRAGVSDTEQVIFNNSLGRNVPVEATPFNKNFLTRGLTAGAIESGEEAAQSAGEQGFENLATGQPVTKGMGNAIAMGAVTAFPMGAVPGALGNGPLARAADASLASANATNTSAPIVEPALNTTGAAQTSTPLSSETIAEGNDSLNAAQAKKAEQERNRAIIKEHDNFFNMKDQDALAVIPFETDATGKEISAYSKVLKLLKDGMTAKDAVEFVTTTLNNRQETDANNGTITSPNAGNEENVINTGKPDTATKPSVNEAGEPVIPNATPTGVITENDAITPIKPDVTDAATSATPITQEQATKEQQQAEGKNQVVGSTDGSAQDAVENIVQDKPVQPSGVIESKAQDEVKPFVATHELPDGTQVIPVDGESNVWLDANDEEHISDYATLKEPTPIQPTQPTEVITNEKESTNENATNADESATDEQGQKETLLDTEGSTPSYASGIDPVDVAHRKIYDWLNAASKSQEGTPEKALFNKYSSSINLANKANIDDVVENNLIGLLDAAGVEAPDSFDSRDQWLDYVNEALQYKQSQTPLQPPSSETGAPLKVTQDETAPGDDTGADSINPKFILNDKNKPFKNDKLAEKSIIDNPNLSQETHVVVKYNNGYAIAPITSLTEDEYLASPSNNGVPTDAAKRSFQALKKSQTVDNKIEKSAEPYAIGSTVLYNGNRHEVLGYIGTDKIRLQPEEGVEVKPNIKLVSAYNPVEQQDIGIAAQTDTIPKDSTVTWTTKSGKVIQGTVNGITDKGKLKITANGKLFTKNQGDVKLVSGEQSDRVNDDKKDVIDNSISTKIPEFQDDKPFGFSEAKEKYGMTAKEAEDQGIIAKGYDRFYKAQRWGVGGSWDISEGNFATPTEAVAYYFETVKPRREKSRSEHDAVIEQEQNNKLASGDALPAFKYKDANDEFFVDYVDPETGVINTVKSSAFTRVLFEIEQRIGTDIIIDVIYVKNKDQLQDYADLINTKKSKQNETIPTDGTAVQTAIKPTSDESQAKSPEGIHAGGIKDNTDKGQLVDEAKLVGDSGQRPKKLTEKTKYTISNDGTTAYIYTVNKESGKYEKAFEANPAAISFIKENGFKAALDRNLLNPYIERNTPEFTSDENSSLKDKLNLIANSTGKPLFNILAKRLLAANLDGVKVQYVDSLESKNKDGTQVPGKYNKPSQTIFLNKSLIKSQVNHDYTLLHELIHAVTIDKINSNDGFQQRLNKITDALKDHVAKNPVDNEYLKDIIKIVSGNKYELLAHGMSDGIFQKYLKNIDIKEGTTLWNDFVNAILKILGLPHNQSNALSELLSIGDEIIGRGESKSKAELFSEKLLNGESFKNILQARKALTDESIQSGTIEAKKADEDIELASVLAARKIVENGLNESDTFDALVKLADQMPSLNVRTSTSTMQQAYSTPLPIAYVAAVRAGINKNSVVVEPTAGNGALLINANPNNSVVNELNKDRANALESQGFTVTNQDASSFDFGKSIADVVIANPPFGSVKNQNNESIIFKINDKYSTNEIDHAISLNALKAMKDNGSAVLIVGGPAKTLSDEERSKAYNGKAKRSFYYTLYNDYNVTDHFTVSGSLYAKQGASWPVDVIVINGRGKSNLKLPAANLPRIINSIEDLKNELQNDRVSLQQDRKVTEQRKQAKPAKDNEGIGESIVSQRDDTPTSDRQPDELLQRPGGQSKNTGQRPVSDGVNGQDKNGKGRAGTNTSVDKVKNKFQVEYEPVSKENAIGTLVPINMQESTKSALSTLANKHGSIDAYVAGLLNYEKSELGKYFSAEQIDAIALALDNIISGKGFIIGDQCVAGHTKIFDPVKNTYSTIKELYDIEKPINVLSMSQGKLVKAIASPPFKKGITNLYKVKFNNGNEITVTENHRFLSQDGWLSIASGLSLGSSLVSFEDPILKNSEFFQSIHDVNDQHLKQTFEGCQEHYFEHRHQYDEQLPALSNNALAFAPLLNDVDEHNQLLCNLDDQDFSQEYTHHYQPEYPHSKNGSFPLATHDLSWTLYQDAFSVLSQSEQIHQVELLYLQLKEQLHQSAESIQNPQTDSYAFGLIRSECEALYHYLTNISLFYNGSIQFPEKHQQHAIQKDKDQLLVSYNNPIIKIGDYTGMCTIESIEFVGVDDFYDMWVPGYENYVAEGVINHNTGIGKGRVNAAMIKYAILNKIIPIFVTEKPNLYGDMIRDLNDIGMTNVKPFVTNSGESVTLDKDAQEWYTENERAKENNDPKPPKYGKFLTTPSVEAHEIITTKITESGELKDYDVIFTTYNQMQPGKKSNPVTFRHAFLETFSKGSLLILDESHNAGGTSLTARKGGENVAEVEEGAKVGRAGFVRRLVSNAQGVFYSSATYAKRPDVLDLYSKTDMGLISDPNQLKEALQAGGVPLQQAVASMLAKTGQYIRREKSFDGISYDTVTVEVDRNFAEQASQVMRDIMLFDQLKGSALKTIDNNLKSEARTITPDKSTGGAGASSTNFTSVMHNMIAQMLLSLKVQPTIDEAISALQRGEKPVITLSNTMGSAIEEYAKEAGLNPGDIISLNFGDLLTRYLHKSRRVTEGDPFGKKETRTLTDDELGPVALSHFKKIEQKIKDYNFSAYPVSPIDAMHHALRQAGYKTGEITGRQSIIDYSKGTPIYKKRPAQQTTSAGKRKTINDFNNGLIDVVILNQSGATGLSLHSSPSAGDDTRKRYMIIAQPELNIDTHMQMLGRINRTGQVILPGYAQITANIPAEKRPSAILAKKMAMLNAQTTAGKESAVKAKDVPDFMNDYGDEIVAAIMNDNRTLHKRLGSPLSESTTTGFETDGAMRKVTGRIPVLPLKEQEQLYTLIEDSYNEYIDMLNKTGQNQLEAQALALDAKTIKTQTVVKPLSDSQSPFAEGVQAEIVDVKKLGKPYTLEQIKDLISKIGITDRASKFKFVDDLIEKIDSEKTERRAELDAMPEDDAGDIHKKRDAIDFLNSQSNRLANIIKTYPPTSSVSLVAQNGVEYLGYVGNIERKGDSKNFFAMSQWKITVYVADAARQFVIPLSKVSIDANEIGKWVLGAEIPAEVNEALLMGHSESREERVILTGNMLSAYAFNKTGQIISYTTHDGKTVQGILMPKKFNLETALNSQPVKFHSANLALEYITRNANEYNQIQNNDKSVRIIPPRTSREPFALYVPSTESKGAIFFKNARLLPLVRNKNFVKKGKDMVAWIEADNIADALNIIYPLTGSLEAASKEKGKEFLNEKDIKKSQSSTQTTNPHTKATLTKAIDGIYGADWTRRLLGTGKVELISSDEAFKLHGNDAQNAQAFYNPATDKSYLVYDNISKDDNVKGLLVHEIGIHQLKMNKDDKEFQSILSEVKRLKKDGDKVILEAFSRVPEDTKPGNVVEETLAYLTQYHPELPIVKRFIAWIKAQLRKLGKALPSLDKAKWMQWANTLSSEDLVYMAHAALKSAPESLMFDSVGSDDNTIKRAQAAGYKGNDRSESEEWLRAVAKGLDMSQEARMQRAKDMGFDVDEDVWFYHNSPDKAIDTIKESGTRFDGLFASKSGKSTHYGNHEHIFIAKNLMTHREFSELYDENFDVVRDVMERELNDFNMDDIEQEYYDDLEKLLKERVALDGVMVDRSDEGYPSEIPDWLKYVTGFSDYGDISWELQRVRGRIAKELGADAIDMKDETGISTLLLPGNGVRSINAAFDPDYSDSPNLLASSTTARFYSALTKMFRDAPAKIFGNPQQVKTWLNANTAKFDVKKDEVYWSGINDWLDMQTGKVSQDDVMAFLKENGVNVEDVVLGNEKPTKHNTETLTLPGGKDYKELVVTIPAIEKFNEQDATHFGDVGNGKQIAWLRLNTRTDSNGNASLFLEEVQSQRGSEGRIKEFSEKRKVPASWEVVTGKSADGNVVYNIRNATGEYIGFGRTKEQAIGDAFDNTSKLTNLIPPAPFITDSNNKATNAYITLLLKKAVSEAIDNGQQSVSWTTGIQQSERYNLKNQLKKVGYDFYKKELTYTDLQNKSHSVKVSPNARDIAEYIGDDLAEKLLSKEPDQQFQVSLSGNELESKSAWTAAMYGNEQGLNAQGKPSMVMQAANDIARKFGGRVESIKLDTGMQPALIITPEMKAKILHEGMPLFSQKASGPSTNNIKYSKLTEVSKAVKEAVSMRQGKHPLNWLGMLFQRDMLIDFASDKLPMLKKYRDLAHEKDNMINKAGRVIDQQYNLFKDKLGDIKEANKLGRIQGIVTRLKNFDPDTHNGVGLNPQKMAIYNEYKALKESTKEVYRAMRKDYQDDLLAGKEALIKRINDYPTDQATRAEIIKELSLYYDKFLQSVYFPLPRFGQTRVRGVNSKGEEVISFTEDSLFNDASGKLAKEMKANGYDVTIKRIKSSRDVSETANDVAAIAVKTIKGLQDGTIDKTDTQALDEINQLLLDALPSVSYRKHFIHRKGTLGYSEDTLRAYAHTRHSAAKHIAGLTYDHKVTKQLNDAQKALDAMTDPDTEALGDVLGRLVTREKVLGATTISPASQVLTSLGFFGALGFNVSSAAVNLSQVPLVTLPELIGQYGEAKAFKSMMDAYKLIFDKNVPGWEEGLDLLRNPKVRADANLTKALKYLQDNGIIDLTQAHDAVSQGSNPAYSDNVVTRTAGAIAKYAGYLFHVTEAVNRQITGIATFKLEFAKNGGDFDAAILKTVETINRTQFNYSMSNRAQFMISGPARVATLFKAYALSMSYFIGRNMHNMLKSEDREVRLAAKKTFVWQMAMTFMASGLFGLPIGAESFFALGGVAGFKAYGSSAAVPGAMLGMALFQVLLAGLGADDEDELEVEFRNWLSDNFNQSVAEFVTKGPMRALPVGDISGRVGLDHLWWRPQNKELEGRDQYNAFANALLGPLGSQAAGLFTAAKFYQDDQYQRMFEAMSPAFARNASAAWRLNDEGVRTIKGDPIVNRDLSFNEIFLQKLLGFNPSVIANASEANTAIVRARDKINMKKAHLVNRYIDADINKRKKLMREDIKEFNKTVPISEQITFSSLVKSIRARKGKDKRTEHGLYLGKKQEHLRDVGRFFSEN